MRSLQTMVAFAAFLIAAVLSVAAAVVAVNTIEDRSVALVEAALAEEQIDWIHVEADGLQVSLSGTAPTEATRFRAISVAGKVVDSSRITDFVTVDEGISLQAPEFLIEILQNADGISLVGLIPAETDRNQLISSLRRATNGSPVVDLLQSAQYDTPEGWDQALLFAYEALKQLERSKISVSANGVSITAITESQEARASLERRFRDRVPKGVELTLDISAPRPVLTPFALRFTLENGVGRFDACAADSPEAQARIIAAAQRAGLAQAGTCTIGLGVPSTTWARAVEASINALATLGGGTLSIADADIVVTAQAGTDPKLYERTIAELEADLPELFSLSSQLLVAEEPTGEEGDERRDFVATLSPEGQVQLRGHVTNERIRSAVESYAIARFGRDFVYAPLSLDPEMPEGWPMRVFAGLAALAELNYGSVDVQPDQIAIKGVTGNQDTRARLAAILAEQIPAGTDVSIDVAYIETLDPTAALPSPQECVDRINAILSANKLTFDPGADSMAPGASQTLDQIAEIMRDCQDVPIEIAGHTDSQGRESMNLSLSQARAEAVLMALMSRRVLTANLTAKGYGETDPIATNDTPEGREENRRIEFTLLSADDVDGENQETAEEAAQDAEGEGTEEAQQEEAKEEETADE
ncbi:OmpA family protein [Halocynthiibacter sp. C4]|uniref:OmpA family protein n=1 Tax=Halocynthiibacter sp. C4 TaxID=2992758 RepID=UPI00237A3E14|nr:OmpA family protein [Halocynthiibacter sp. C4]MDE0590841.1 OmpA family protein [Halocynthiibacter sp. C4]